MNKDLLKIASLVAGVITAVVALFLFIEGIMTLTRFSGNLEVKDNIYLAVIGTIQLAATAGFGMISYFIINEFVKKQENKNHWYLCAAATYFCYTILMLFITMVFYNVWGNARSWVIIVFDIAGIVLAVVALTGKFDGITNKIVGMIVFILGFVLSVINLVGAGGLSVATNIFIMFMFISFFVYYLLIVIANQGTTAKVEATEVEEEKAEETKAE